VERALLRCIGILADVEAGGSDDTCSPPSDEDDPEAASRASLRALFLTNREGRIEDHSIAGARIARRFCRGSGFAGRNTRWRG